MPKEVSEANVCEHKDLELVHTEVFRKTKYVEIWRCKKCKELFKAEMKL